MFMPFPFCLGSIMKFLKVGFLARFFVGVKEIYCDLSQLQYVHACNDGARSHWA